MISAVAIDIDGTLVTMEGRLPERNRAALVQAARQGVLLVLATARSVSGAIEILDALGLSGALIAELGATIVDANGVVVETHRFPVAEAEGIIDDLLKASLRFICTVDGVNYESSDSLGARSGVRRKLNVSATDYSQTSRIVVRDSSLAGVQDLLAQHAVGFYLGAAIPGGTHDVILVPQGVSKGRGMAALCKHRGIDRSNVLAIGDSSTDIELIEWAGIGVAVADGDPSLREKATWVAPPAESGSVAEALIHFSVVESLAEPKS
jgi:HAD superfamily hydrolase (TIGR01484 family)